MLTRFNKQRVNMEDGTHLLEHKDSTHQKGKKKKNRWHFPGLTKQREARKVAPTIFYS